MKTITINIEENDEQNIGFVLNYIAEKIKKGSTGNKNFPVNWKIQQAKPYNTIFVLFETDIHKSKHSRVFCGTFESPEIAMENAKLHNCLRQDCKIEIIETQLNNFKEI